MNQLVSKEEWLRWRMQLLEQEKEFTKARDALNELRRNLPWVKVDKQYVFDSTNGPRALGDLFETYSQLIVYHFMFGPDWEQGCKSCSFWADNFNNTIVHLNQRDVNLVAISRGPLDKLQAFRKRMNWSFEWVSSAKNDFNFDFHVSFREGQTDGVYNFDKTNGNYQELPGISVFYKDENDQVYHTYSCYSRGLDMLNGTYHYLDIVPKGRDEEGLAYNHAWINFKDIY